jgi:dihydrofolate synthase / folylpolyglutamate synthase
MKFSDALAALDRRTNYERSGRLTAPTLDRIAALMDLMDHPERHYPAIHITGTNGKTTCARAATEVLRAAGLRVATYTSPHVESVRERFTYDGASISEAEFVEAWRELDPYLKHFDDQDKALTWFEAATALAFTWFADRAVDAAVVEVGMGGEWDATNVIDGGVAAIARIDVDHPELGSTPAEVALEKAKIIKRDSIACVSEQQDDVLELVRTRCTEVGAELRYEGPSFALEKAPLALGGQAIVARLGDDRYQDLFLPMFGEQFAHDALLGAAAARAMLGDKPLSEEVLQEGFARVRVPGRMEIVHRAPLIVLDGAHNPSAARALVTAMTASFRWDRLFLVASVMADKDMSGILGPLIDIADQIIVTQNASPRAASVDRMQQEVRALGKDSQSVANVADAISVAIERAEDSDAVLVAGSLYTVGEARRVLVAAPESSKERW